ncbi:hypothetical protein CcCBS67573_g03476 [Chytriomyces confervae]|uniref:non-specific serine/threonine protein kinase n=1 Tax=Chytriomyces confervae TaxID=246404 RepID=A0A507FHY3_9FUNG|nr:hypothetical protein CcCBS67573_g03476 [Chytriomyces confervae]
MRHSRDCTRLKRSADTAMQRDLRDVDEAEGPAKRACLRSPTQPSFIQTQTPVEVIQRIFALLHPNEAIRMRRLCSFVNKCILDRHFAVRNLNHSIATLNSNTPFSTANNSSCQSAVVTSIPTKPNKYMLRNAKRFAKAFPTPLDRSWFLWPDSFQQAYLHASATPNSSHPNQSSKSNNSSVQTLPPLSETHRLPWAARNLTGIIPRALGCLQKLTYLNLSGNHLHGTIPSDLGNLTSLIELDLSSNAFTGGGIPKEFGNLTRLRRLNLSNNALGGSIPVELSRLENLEILYLVCVGLSGEIPSELSRLTKLKEMHISCNRGLRGVIPPDLWKCTQLEILCLSGNALTGCVPRELSRLEKLKVCDLGMNRLVGVVPVEVVQLPVLRELKLGGNLLVQPDEFVDARKELQRVLK